MHGRSSRVSSRIGPVNDCNDKSQEKSEDALLVQNFGPSNASAIARGAASQGQ